MSGHAPWAEQGDVVGDLEIGYQKELYIFNAQNPVLVKSPLTSDSGSTTEAGRVFLQQQQADVQHTASEPF